MNGGDICSKYNFYCVTVFLFSWQLRYESSYSVCPFKGVRAIENENIENINKHNVTMETL